MVYTKHFVIHSFVKLKNSDDYVKNAAKTAIKNSKSSDHLENIFPYVFNADKTKCQQLVSGFGINNVENASDEFIATKLNAAYAKGTDITFDFKTGKMKPILLADLEKNNAVLAHHLIQSFSPDDNLTPEEIHMIGRKTVLELTGEEHEFIIATHVDKKHIHNHIIFNSTNLVTHKAFRWQKGTKKIFEKISDKHAALAGAKIIEKSPKNSHKKYTMWQTENIYKSKIKSRLDFLLAHSSNIEDFKIKAEALNLKVDFSKKWATYRLLDEPQIQNTRSRSLTKSDPEKYNLKNIMAELENNSVAFTVDEVVSRYQEKTSISQTDFDYQVTVENWQIEFASNKGYYLNVDFGVANHGQIFMPAYKVDRLENGNYNLYIKKSDFFYFMNEKKADRNRYMKGDSLCRQLSLYNGTVPIRKEPVISSLNDLVDAINFLAQHDVTKSKQMLNLELKLNEKLLEAQSTLEQLDYKIIELNQKTKTILNQTDNNAQAETQYHELQNELMAAKLSRQLLNDKFTETVEEVNTFNELRYAAKEKLDPDINLNL